MSRRKVEKLGAMTIKGMGGDGRIYYLTSGKRIIAGTGDKRRYSVEGVYQHSDAYAGGGPGYVSKQTFPYLEVWLVWHDPEQPYTVPKPIGPELTLYGEDIPNVLNDPTGVMRSFYDHAVAQGTWS